MRLVEAGRLDLDAPVVDACRSSRSRPRGDQNDHHPTTAQSHQRPHLRLHPRQRARGRLPRQVRRGREGRGARLPPGTAISYSSVGYNVLGRIIEVLTGKVWDQALDDLLLTPLGLTRTMTLPEQALRFRAAMGHLGEPGQRRNRHRNGT